MNIFKRRRKLMTELIEKEYRDAFVSSHIDIGIPFQVRALREQRGWTQKELAQSAEMKQERISAIENPNYKNQFSLKTLKRLASAFDVGLIVRFVPISELVEWEIKLSPEALKVLSFKEDPYFKEQPPQEYNMIYAHPELPFMNIVAQGGIVFGGEGIVNVINPPKPSKREISNIADFRKPLKQREEMASQLQKAMMGA
jgi:transcriptional regulator with XRE-family HTH domain